MRFLIAAMFLVVCYFCLTVGSSAMAGTYPIIKLLNLSDKAVIRLDDDDFLEKGDRLYLENSFGQCRSECSQLNQRRH